MDRVVDFTQAVLLCGGVGARLREETEFRPKPMVEVGGRPILWHIMKTYAHYGFHDFVLCLGYRGNIIKEYFLNYEAMNNDFTICLGQKSQIQYHDLHTEQGFQVSRDWPRLAMGTLALTAPAFLFSSAGGQPEPAEQQKVLAAAADFGQRKQILHC
jgi:NDP-sugar pyrophosphorylase family protein